MRSEAGSYRCFVFAHLLVLGIFHLTADLLEGAIVRTRHVLDVGVFVSSLRHINSDTLSRLAPFPLSFFLQ